MERHKPLASNGKCTPYGVSATVAIYDVSSVSARMRSDNRLYEHQCWAWCPAMIRAVSTGEAPQDVQDDREVGYSERTVSMGCTKRAVKKLEALAKAIQRVSVSQIALALW